MSEPTLLQLLGHAARLLEGGEEWQEKPRVATGLRAAAARLREEMERAQFQRGTTADFGEVESSRCLDAICRVLERINGSASPPPATGTAPKCECDQHKGHGVVARHQNVTPRRKGERAR